MSHRLHTFNWEPWTQRYSSYKVSAGPSFLASHQPSMSSSACRDTLTPRPPPGIDSNKKEKKRKEHLLRGSSAASSLQRLSLQRESAARKNVREPLSGAGGVGGGEGPRPLPGRHQALRFTVRGSAGSVSAETAEGWWESRNVGRSRQRSHVLLRDAFMSFFGKKLFVKTFFINAVKNGFMGWCTSSVPHVNICCGGWLQISYFGTSE